MFDEHDPDDADCEPWKFIAEYMDGETALVAESELREGEYIFLGLTDPKNDKELFYMIEQDSMIGTYINDRSAFEEMWESGEYEKEEYLYLKSECLEFLEN